MNVLVTGGTGFVGQHLVACLQARGHGVTILSRGRVQPPQSWREKAKIIQFDIDSEFDSLPQAILDHDAVAHLAWPGLPNYDKTTHFEQTLPNQLRFLTHLMRGGVKQILGIGTCFEYGMQEGLMQENMCSQPANAYAMAKDTLHRFASKVAQEKGVRFQWARLFYMHGAGQSEDTLMGQLKKAIQSGDSRFNMSGGEQLRDFLEIGDVAGYLARVLEHKEFCGAVNICSGEPISVRKLVERQIEKLGARIDLNLGYYPYSEYEPMAFWGDRTRLDQLLS